MADLQRALAVADRETRIGVRTVMRGIADPVARDAEQLARSEIRNIGEQWPRMRVGLTRVLLYVAPRERGTKGRGRRPNLAGLLDTKAMSPAADRHRHGFEAAVGQALDRMADRFNHGTPV